MAELQKASAFLEAAVPQQLKFEPSLYIKLSTFPNMYSVAVIFRFGLYFPSRIKITTVKYLPSHFLWYGEEYRIKMGNKQNTKENAARKWK